MRDFVDFVVGSLVMMLMSRKGRRGLVKTIEREEHLAPAHLEWWD